MVIEEDDCISGDLVSQELATSVDYRIQLENLVRESNSYIKSLNDWKEGGFDLTHEEYLQRIELENFQKQQQLLKEKELKENAVFERTPVICMAAKPPPEIATGRNKDKANKNLFNHDDLIRSPRAAPVVFSTNAHLNDVTNVFSKAMR